MLRRALAAVVTVVAMHGLAAATELAGVPHVVSGNAITIGKTRLWLAGVGAPGLAQLCLDAAGARWTCGVTARDELARHVGGGPVSCQTEHRESPERLVGVCTVNGQDVGRWMIANGWAIAGAHATRDYEAAEADARTRKAGLWAGAFIAPREWHRRNPQAQKLGALDISPAARATLLHGHFGSAPPSPDCAIKGHVNRSGTCIYHMPGGRWYARVSINPDNGDRWFCSREEAELASCRETRR